MKLILFFTRGVSLQTWNEIGMFEREVALYKSLGNQGVDVQFITYGKREDLHLASRIGKISLRCNTWNMPINWYERILEWVPPKGNIFKSNQMAGSEVAMVAASHAGARFIARCGYWYADFNERHYGFDSLHAIEARALERRVFARANQIVVTTSRIKESLIERYKLPDGKLKVIPNYVETNIFRPQEKVKNSRPRIVFVGRLAAKKNLFALISALSEADAELVLIGDGPLRKDLEVAAQNSKSQVTFLGNVPNHDLPSLLNKSDVFVLPSLHEGQPKTLQEAMSCGLAVLGGSVPGITELINDGINGLLCEPSVEGIRAGLQKLISDDQLRTQLEQSARHFIEEHFSLGRVLEMELAMLQELAD